MKKALIILLALLVPATLMATPIIQLGGTVFYDPAVSAEDFVDGFSDLDNYRFGVEARLNIADWVSLAVPATLNFGNDSFSIATHPSLNLNIPVVDFLDLALGLGTGLDFRSSDDNWFVNGADIEDFGDAFLNAKLFYRAAVTVNVGMLGVGISASVPTEGSFNDFSMTPDFENTKVSASLLFNFF